MFAWLPSGRKEGVKVWVVGLFNSEINQIHVFTLHVLCIQFTLKIMFNQTLSQLIWAPLSLNQPGFAGPLVAQGHYIVPWRDW